MATFIFVPIARGTSSDGVEQLELNCSQPMHPTHRTPPPQTTIPHLQNPQLPTTQFLLPPTQQQTIANTSAAHLGLNQTPHILASKTSYPPGDAIQWKLESNDD